MPVPTGILGLLRALENTQRKAFQVNSKDIEILRKRQTESEDRLDRSWMPEKGKRVLGGFDNRKVYRGDRVKVTHPD